MQISDGRFFNPICTVRMLGFESDTLTLQRAGWQLSAQQDYHFDGIALAMKHEKACLYALTNSVPMMRMVRASSPDFRQTVAFDVICCSSNMHIQVMRERDVSAFFSIDAEPAFTDTFERKSIADLIPFRPISVEAPEIIVDPAKVGEIMDLILKAQDPKQAEIRERKRREAWHEVQAGFGGYNPVSDIRAQIISLAS